MDIKCPSKLVGILGKDAACDIWIAWDGEAPPGQIQLARWPEFLLPIRQEADLEDTGPGKGLYRFEFMTSDRGRGKLEINAAGERLLVPAVVFREAEFFLAMVISSNYHYGWDPLSYLFGNGPEKLDLKGHAYPKTRQLERMYHDRGVPITWLVDEKVAEVAAEDIVRWHYEYGDDYGVMPTSYIFHNSVDYNTSKTIEETLDFVGAQMAGVERHFPFRTGTLAIDQWIGSVGTKFTLAAYEMGLHALWGIGFDHRTCDTSMFHRGCPWDVYKPSKVNFRVPATHPSNLWMFQWTTRDIINTMHTPDGGPGGAVIFSTDADDVRVSEIMARQPDYWIRMLREYKSNMDHNDCFVFLVHQEDHDCHFPENADYLRAFLKEAADEVTPATLEEIAQWLNLKYGAEEHPSQALWLNDPLTCHEGVHFYFGVEPPPDWPAEGEQYPPHVAYYCRDALWIIEQGRRTPIRRYDYTAQHQVGETDVYPPALLPNTTVHQERIEQEEHEFYYMLELESNSAAANLPFAVWDVSFNVLMVIKERPAPGVTTIGNCLVMLLDVREGRHAYRVRLTEP